MKEIQLSFPYPSTSRHNLSQDVAFSMPMGMVIPARIVEVLPGDSHRIGTSFSLVSNPIVKPLLQSVLMRYSRFWVPRRIYHLAMRANNSDYDPQVQGVRFGNLTSPLFIPVYDDGRGVTFVSNFHASSLVDYLGMSPFETGSFLGTRSSLPPLPAEPAVYRGFRFNAEPYIGYLDICRNYFADSANGMIAFMTCSTSERDVARVGVGDLEQLDVYIDNIQNTNSQGAVSPFFLRSAYILDNSIQDPAIGVSPVEENFSPSYFGMPYFGLCVPMVRPDRLSRMFSTKPLTSQNAQISGSEITIGNLSFLAKLQRYLTRRFFGGSRYTDVMYSVFGQKVPHVDSPVLLDVFDTEVGSELVASTNADNVSNPGVLGGYFSCSGVLKSGRGSTRKRYTFNEAGYIIDLVYIMPRIFRTQFLSDFYPVSSATASATFGAKLVQGNFLPDFNGIGWQQPAFNSIFYQLAAFGGGGTLASMPGYSAEPSWQQYRTLPDVVRGLLNPCSGLVQRDFPSGTVYLVASATRDINSPIFVFTDHFAGDTVSRMKSPFERLADNSYVSPRYLNSIFGFNGLVDIPSYFDNIFVVFRYSHQSKRQVTKRFTLTF